MSASDRDYERIFIGNRQIDVRHFYGIGENHFAVGYSSQDVYWTGIVSYSVETGTFTVFSGNLWTGRI